MRSHIVERGLASVGRKAESTARHAGSMAMLIWRVAGAVVRGRVPLREFVAQTFDMGVRSLPLVLVVAVLAGVVNTRLVAALGSAGVRAVGLTGADGSCGLSDVAPPHMTAAGQTVDLERVGLPADDADMSLLRVLLGSAMVPVVASVGVDRAGRLLNVNADTMAGHLAAKLTARRLVIAGSTPGVLDENGATVRVLDPAAIARLVAAGTANAGMIAKLRACEHALKNGVDDVVIVDGRDRDALRAAASGAVPAPATRVAATVGTRS